MEVALTRTDGVAGSESTPLLLFWKETDFSTGTLGSPYKTSTPAGGIGDYADAPYNTETDYPADNSRVVVMGLCPSAMTTADSHTTYSLPSRAGLTDVLVTPNGVTGSSLSDGHWSLHTLPYVSCSRRGVRTTRSVSCMSRTLS